jgi:PRC-barrel domain protein
VDVFEDQTPLTWQRTPASATVYSADGSDIGSVESVLGDEEADIFHGLAVRGSGGKVLELPAAHVKKICAGGVVTDLYPDGVAALRPYGRR